MGSKALKYTNTTDFDFASVRSLLDIDQVFRQDQLGQANPVVTFLEEPHDIRKHFNDITYLKGAAVLVMLETALGEDVFQRIVQVYINTFAYGTASTHDFIRVVEKTCSKKIEVRDFLESFLYQKHFPIVEVTDTNEAYVLKQVSSGINDTKSRWTIPITYTTDLERDIKVVWFDRNMEELFVPKREEKWILFNYNNDGYYKINYSATLWDRFYKYCMEMESSNLERLISEAIDLFRLKIISCKDVLNHVIGIGRKCEKSLLDVLEVQYFLLAIQRYDSSFYSKVKAYTDSQSGMTQNENNVDSSEDLRSVEDDSLKQIPTSLISCIEWAKANFSSTHTILDTNSTAH